MSRFPLLAAIVLAAAPVLATAQDTGSGGSADLARQLSNPVSSLISVPFQYNWNDGFGPNGDGQQSFINIQPVIPFSISPNWNLISRTILPLVDQDGVIPGAGSQRGFGNTIQSFFFSPKAPTAGGLIWGAGPVFQLPTATDDLGPNQWGAGITGVVLKQSQGWTYGALANHIWSLNNGDEYGDQSASFLQPFLSFTTPKATSFTVNSESTYNWETEEWSVPVNLMVAQMVKLGQQPAQIQAGARYWLDSPDGGPDGWGFRFAFTLLFPK